MEYTDFLETYSTINAADQLTPFHEVNKGLKQPPVLNYIFL